MAERWLVKTEPAAYSFEQLVRDGRTVWDGVKNPLALKHLAAMRRGDHVLVYHTGEEKAVVGTATAASDPYPDPRQRDEKLLVIELAAGKPLPRPVTLAEIKADSVLEGFDLARLPRLSVMPVDRSQWDEIMRLARIG